MIKKMCGFFIFIERVNKKRKQIIARVYYNGHEKIKIPISFFGIDCKSGNIIRVTANPSSANKTEFLSSCTNIELDVGQLSGKYKQQAERFIRC